MIVGLPLGSVLGDNPSSVALVIFVIVGGLVGGLIECLYVYFLSEKVPAAHHLAQHIFNLQATMSEEPEQSSDAQQSSERSGRIEVSRYGSREV